MASDTRAQRYIRCLTNRPRTDPLKDDVPDLTTDTCECYTGFTLTETDHVKPANDGARAEMERACQGYEDAHPIPF